MTINIVTFISSFKLCHLLNSSTCLKNSIDFFPEVNLIYKKVLLRERKRHTARRVASARYAALCNGGGGTHLRSGGTPSQVWVGGTPSQVRGVPHLRSGWGGVPHPRSRWGVPHFKSGFGGYPISGWGGTLSQDRGYPIPGQGKGGTPSQVWVRGEYPISGLGVPWVPPTIQT